MNHRKEKLDDIDVSKNFDKPIELKGIPIKPARRIQKLNVDRNLEAKIISSEKTKYPATKIYEIESSDTAPRKIKKEIALEPKTATVNSCEKTVIKTENPNRHVTKTEEKSKLDSENT